MGALVEHAKLWGAMKHKEQVRKYTGEPYFTHCEAVADLVTGFYENVLDTPAPEEVIAATLLHDVVEDTDATFGEVIELFGEETAQLVYYLTKPLDIAGNRAQRKALYHNKLALAPETVKIIKFFDMFHNHASIQEHDPALWKVWREETKRAMVAMEIYEVCNGALVANHAEFVTKL